MKDLALQTNLKEGCINFLQRLIQTESRSGEEKDIAELVISEMESLGYDEVYADEAGNVIGKIEGSNDSPPIMFNTHLDHVDVGDPDEWPHHPFGGEIHGDCVWGRGAVDIKGPLAAQVYGVSSAYRGMGKPAGDIYVTSVVQEEVGGVGALHLLSHLSTPVVIVGEPSSNKIKRGHRGRLELLVKVRGYSVHASVPERGVNPLKVIANFVKNVDDIDMAIDKDFGLSTVALTKITSDQESTNVIPAEIDLICDWRNVPGETENDVLNKLESAIAPSLIEGTTANVSMTKYKRVTYTGLEMEIPASNYPFKMNKDDPVLINSLKILESSLGELAEPGFWDFATDGGHFSRAGLKIIGFGPGDESLAHTINERIPISQIREAIIGYQSLAKQLQSSL